MPRTITCRIVDHPDVVIDEIVASCNGDMRGAFKALLLVNEQLESELNHLYEAAASGSPTERAAKKSLHLLYDFLGSAAAVLVTRLKSLHCGFGFDPSFINCIGCERDIWRTGLRHPVNDAALLLQRIQYHVKGGFPFRGL